MCAWYSDRSVHVRVCVLGEGGGGGLHGQVCASLLCSAVTSHGVIPVNCTQGSQTPHSAHPTPPPLHHRPLYHAPQLATMMCFGVTKATTAVLPAECRMRFSFSSN